MADLPTQTYLHRLTYTDLLPPTYLALAALGHRAQRPTQILGDLAGRAKMLLMIKSPVLYLVLLVPVLLLLGSGAMGAQLAVLGLTLGIFFIITLLKFY